MENLKSCFREKISRVFPGFYVLRVETGFYIMSAFGLCVGMCVTNIMAKQITMYF